MVDQVQSEDTPAVEEVEEKPAEQPKAPAAQRAKRSDIAELQATKDREVAQANQKASAAEQALAEAIAERDAARDHLDITRKQANISDNEDDRNKAFAQWQRELSQRQESVQQHERTVTITHLAQVYGIPAEDLSPYDNPLEMKIAAMEWRDAHREEPTAEAVEDEPEEKPDESDEDDADNPPSRSNFDMGDGSGKTKNIKDMTDDEFEKDLASRKARARNDLIRRR